MPSASDTISRILFAVLFVAANGVFVWTLIKYIRRISKGRPDDVVQKPSDRLTDPRAYWDVIVYWLGQRKVAATPGKGYPYVRSSLHHLPIFYGFLIITIGTTEMLIQGLFPAFHYGLILGDTLSRGLRYIIDVTNGLVLLMIVWAFFRRIVLKPRLIPINLDAALILGMIGGLMVTHFLMHSAHYAFAVKSGAPVWASALNRGIAEVLWSGAGAGTLHTIAAINWWLHVGIVLFFLNYIPYSKHIHLLGALPTIFFRRRGQSGIMPKLDLEMEDEDEDEEAEPRWGVGKFEQLSWRSILDTHACTECARCSNYCPAYNTGKPLSPMKIIHDVRYEARDRGDLLHQLGKAQKAKDEAKIKEVETALQNLKPLVADGAEADPSKAYLGSEALWACTTCGACEEVCPVFIEHPMKILEMRQNLVLEQEAFPTELQNAYRGLERNMNPWGLGMDTRFDWAPEDTLMIDEDEPDAEEFDYLYFVGCAGSYDRRAQKQVQALLKIADKAGIKLGIAMSEVCSGDPARRTGNEFIFQAMAQQNVETLNAIKPKKIVTACPHCLHTIKNEYPQFDGNYEVLHHTQLIAEILASGKLELEDPAGGQNGGKVTYHDPCYLGRWNKVYDDPRSVLHQLAGENFVELPRHGSKSFCCGAGGGRFWVEEEDSDEKTADGRPIERVNNNRAREIVESGAKTVAVACPFCTTMVSDGLKALNKEEEVEVLDIGEMVAARLGGDSGEAEGTEADAAE